MSVQMPSKILKERGASLLEATLLIALVAVVAIFAVRDIGYAISGTGQVEVADDMAADRAEARDAPLGIFNQVSNALGKGSAEDNEADKDEEEQKR